MAILVDTSALYAMTDRGTVEHDAVRLFVTETHDALLIPVTVLAEADYLITTRLGPSVALAVLRSIAAGEFRLEQVMNSDLVRCTELLEQYADSRLGFVDVSIIALAERLNITRVLTLDQRHFRFVRPRHCAAFDVVPRP